MGVDEKVSASEINAIIAAYPQEKRCLLAMMQDLQRKFNYLPRTGIERLAEHVGVPVSNVYSLATFYKAFSLVPKGRYNIRVCDGTACHIKGSNVLIDQIYSTLGIRPGETSPDGEFSLETVNCLGACAIAPVMLVNGRVHSKVSNAAVAGIINGYRGNQG